jgi:3-oxoadipate enol-lactonase
MFADINGHSLFYEVIGPDAAPPVVFLHGMSFSHQLWSKQAAAFSTDYRLILPDFRGHGQSAIGDGQYTQKLFVEDLIALLDHLHLWRVTLCGLSLGGAVAMRTALDHPERVSGLVLSNTRADADSYDDIVWRERVTLRIKKMGVHRYIETFLKTIFAPESFATRTQEVDLIRHIMRVMPPLAMCGALISQAARPNLVPRLYKIKVPTLVIAGELDTFTPPSLAEQIQDAIPGSMLRLVPHSAHMSPLENPEEYNHLLREFLPLTHDHSPGQNVA